MRYPLEVCRAMRAAWPAQKPMSVRISAHDWMGENGMTDNDAVYIASAFKSAGADVVNVSTGQTSHDAKPQLCRMFQTLSDLIRNEGGLPTLAVGNIYAVDHKQHHCGPVVLILSVWHAHTLLIPIGRCTRRQRWAIKDPVLTNLTSISWAIASSTPPRSAIGRLARDPACGSDRRRIGHRKIDCEALAQEGYAVSVMGRREALFQLLEQQLVDRSAAISCDVTSESAVSEAFNSARDKFGPISVLVNCAALLPQPPFINSTTRRGKAP